ncbi:MAG: hypothetical protein H0Z29_07915 [Candidatus Marinimicrobia bacterium]|nr:hypothetical protein [Candidatus Neomarinimicrobiota bacterium]
MRFNPFLLIRVCFVIVIVMVEFLSAADPSPSASAALDVKTFVLDPDFKGLASNSVNLFTGDVCLPLRLVSVSGPNGLGVDVSIVYNSNVQGVVNTWNLEAPTGVLGLGWTFDYNKIIVDNKGTGTRMDDEFYLVMNFSTSRMMRNGKNKDGSYNFVLEEYKFWKIRYYPDDERWEIIDENGIKTIYGGTSEYPSSIQYIVRWGNWIGNSAVTEGQERQAIVWNISAMVDIFGNRITFAYSNVESQVGAGGLANTEASYLSSIDLPDGRSIRFVYGEKFPAEYMEPHTEKAEPDAYQERYERKFLDYIEIRGKGNNRISSIDFVYYDHESFLNYNTNREKRLLKSIVKRDKTGNSLPSISFEYYQSGTFKGFLKSVTFPEGGSVTYSYTAKVVGYSDRDLTISAPVQAEGSVTFKKPRVWLGDDYVVVTWLESNANGGIYRKVIIEIYQWDGRWVKYYFGKIFLNENDKTEKNYEKIQIATERDFIAVLYPKNPQNYKHIHWILQTFLRKKRFGWDWYFYSYLFYDDISFQKYDKEIPMLISGNNFIAVIGQRYGEIYRYMIKGDIDYNKKYFERRDTGDDIDYYGAGTNNYFLFHKQRYDDELYFYYLDELLNWHEVVISSPGFDAGNGNYWHANNNCIVGMLNGTGERIYWWDENFNIKSPFEIPGINDKSEVYFNGPLVSLIGYGYGLFYRYDGQRWRSKDFSCTSGSFHYWMSSGEDFALKKDGTKDQKHYWRRLVFDPNDTSSPWKVTNISHEYQSPAAEAGINCYLFGNTVYYRNNDGNFSSIYTLPDYDGEGLYGVDYTTVRFGRRFLKYDYNDNGSVTTRVVIFKNGEFYSLGSADYGVSNWEQSTLLTGEDCFLTSHYIDIKDTDKLRLYKVLNYKYKGKQDDYPCSSITLNTGYQSVKTYFSYNSSTATYDPTGNVAQYNEVTVRVGDGYGYTKKYFMNGLPSDKVSEPYPSEGTNMEDYHRLLKGVNYCTKLYSDSDILISKTVDYWNVYEKDGGYYSRLVKRITTLDGVNVVTEYKYNLDNWLVNKIIETNSDGASKTTEIRYAFEIGSYADMKDRNMLSQVFQQTVYDGADEISKARSSTVITYKDWGGGKWASYRTYSWLEDRGEGMSLPVFDFITPPGDSEWKLISEIAKRDDRGNVVESKNANGIYTTTKWGYNGFLPVANFTNARDNETFYDGFESGNFSGQFPGWGYHSVGATEVGISSEESHSGMFSLKFDKKDNKWSGVYMNSPYIDVNEGEKWTIVAWYKCRHGRYAYINWYDQTNQKSYLKTQEGTGEWEMIKHTIEAPPGCGKLRVYLYGHKGSENSPIYYDDVIVYPERSLCTYSVYNPETFQILATADENGVTTFYKYDSFGRLREVWDDDNQLLSSHEYYFSKSGNDGVFNQDDPNFSREKRVSVNSFHEGFQYIGSPEGNGWSIYDPSGSIEIIYDDVLKSKVMHAESGEGTGFGVKYPSDGSLDIRENHIWFKVKSVENFIFYVRIKTKDGDLYYTRYEPNDGSPHVSGKYVYHYLGSNFRDGNWHLVDRNLIDDFSLSGKEFESVVNFCIRGGDYYIDDIRLTDRPIITTSYTDGIGRVIQTQVVDGDYDIINKKEYNEIGKVYKKYHPKRYYNADHDYYSCTPVKYELYTYCNDPLARVYKVTHPDGTYIQYEYGKETDNGCEYFVTTVIDENGKKTKTYVDKFGNTRKEIHALGTSDEITVTYTYDILGNLLEIIDPRGLVTSMVYNTMGQLISKTTPDAGTVHYVYDYMGNLVYSQDAEQNLCHSFTVYRYDSFGRLVEVSVEDDYNFLWSGTNYPLLEHISYFGTYSDEVTIKNYYDSNYLGEEPNYCRGRLTKTIEKESETTTYYAYDKYGNIVTKRIHIPGMSQDKVIRHVYDCMGREIVTEYPSGVILINTYNHLGQLKDIKMSD